MRNMQYFYPKIVVVFILTLPPSILRAETQATVPLAQVESAKKSLAHAISSCEDTYPNRVGTMVNRQACLNEAVANNYYPVSSEREIVVQKDYMDNVMVAAQEVDQGAMSLANFESYKASCDSIELRAWDVAEAEDQRDGLEESLQRLAQFDKSNGDSAGYVRDIINIDMLKFQSLNDVEDASQAEYDYCAALYPKKSDACSLQKVARTSDYQSKVSAVLNLPEFFTEERNPFSPFFDDPPIGSINISRNPINN